MDLTAVCSKLSYGMYVVSSVLDGKYNGQIANAVMQVTADPPKVSVAINRDNLTHKYIKESGVFALSILNETAGMPLIGRFGFKTGRDINKFDEVSYIIGSTGAPVLTENCLGYIECELTESLDIDTHTIFIGKIVDSKIFDESSPMTYSYYHMVKGGKTSEKAPTYVKPVTKSSNKVQKGENMKKYRCTICDYIYDPAVGDQDSGIEPGTAFEDIPEDWVCPVCGASKEDFEEVE